MQSIHSLFALIQSLTKTEKRYLAIQAQFQTGDKLYMQLYDCQFIELTQEESEF